MTGFKTGLEQNDSRLKIRSLGVGPDGIVRNTGETNAHTQTQALPVFCQVDFVSPLDSDVKVIVTCISRTVS